jgi:DNA-binding CsgD family transcriptional regulator
MRTTMGKLLDAVEILHSHTRDAFHQRAFRASELLMGDTRCSFEVIEPQKGMHSFQSDAPVSESLRPAWMKRCVEVVHREHPIYPLMCRGQMETTRLSDLIGKRRLEASDLYNDCMKPIDVRYQLIIPFVSGSSLCGLSVNRATRDYSDEDLAAMKLFARHLALAYETDLVLDASAGARDGADLFDHARLRKRGLTRRECEVLWWVAEGKRNGEIGIILGIATVTVEVHLTSIYRRLGVENRMSAVALLRNE